MSFYCTSLNNCVITSNSAVAGGGSYSGTFYNCLFTANAARATGYGGGAAYTTLYNCTVSSNSAPDAGGVFDTILFNSIVYDNSAPTNANYSGGSFNSCCTAPLPGSGTGNITNSPLFVSAAQANFRLQPGSPCFNTGNNLYNGANGLTDLDGNPRFFDSVVDMGAYEIQVSSQPPVVVAQPSDQTSYSGNDVNLTAIAAGSYPESWQWWFNAAPLGGATNATLNLSAVTSSQAGNYSAVISNAFGSTTSQVAVLTVKNAAPTITVQPLPATNSIGSSVSFNATAVGSQPFWWQWMFNGAAISSATDSSLILNSITTNQAGGYSVAASNSFGAVTSSIAVLTVSTDLPPAIIRQPLSQTVGIGNPAAFIADASGSQPLFWQWFFNGTLIPDATNSILTLPSVRPNQAGSYSAVVSNALGTATTASVTLTVGVAAARYVWQNNPNPAPPYTNWSSAATSIQDAVDVAVAEDNIIVTNGIYASGGRIVPGTATTSRVVIDKPLNVRSVNGPAQTQIQGASEFSPGLTPIRCVYLTDGAVLTGFTLTQGATSRFEMGGGAYCTSTNAVIIDCVISGNSALGYGGGVNSGTLINCAVVENSDGAWGSTLYNCTVARNALWVASGGGATFCTLYNCICYGNSASGNYSASTLNYCCTYPLPSAGVGNFTNDPLFVDPVNHNFRLQAGSPCIDSGNNAYSAGALDLDGNPRISGNAVDLGAFEFPETGLPIIAAQPSNQTVFAGSNVIFSVVCTSGTFPIGCVWFRNSIPLPGATNFSLQLLSVSTNQAGAYSVVITNNVGATTSQPATLTVMPGPLPLITMEPQSRTMAPGSTVNFGATALGYQPLSWQWLFNGRPIPQANSPNLILNGVAPGQAGAYSVIVANASGSITSAVATLSVAQTAIRYVSLASPTPAAPYTNWTTAAHSIQDAIGACSSGDTVLVTNGVYKPVLVPSGVELRSINGPRFTSIDGDGLECVALTNDAIISGFTITNGDNGGVAGNWPLGGLVKNCVLVSNYSGWLGAGAIYCTLENCVLIGNSGPTNGCAAAFSTLYNCKLTANTGYTWGGQLQYGAAAFVCSLYGCEITKNAAGGADSSKLYDCTVADNQGSGAASCDSFNSILYNNGSGNFWGGTQHYCCTTPLPSSGIGNITNAPLFVDEANGDFHLQPNSPCINSGDNNSVATSIDLDGNPRVVNGIVDMGADEYQGALPMPFRAWLQSYGLPSDGSADYADTDGDGMNNWQEWVCGTNPTNAASVLRLLSASPISSNVLSLAWQSVPGRNYFVCRSPTLNAPFSILATNIPGQPGLTIYRDTNALSSGESLYRVGVQTQ
ncbi:MAG TPA: immunoglobulin domain-containing protein [Verrucomicrobiae bacterium]|nr:immunoglobulin domain-containing protein [Verrucomicrobiae bacterium]